MLKSHVLDSATVLADKLSKNNLQVEALRETPLAQVIDACYHPRIENEVEEACMSFHDLLRMETEPADNGAISHDDAVKNVIDIVSKTINDNMVLAKNVVNPIILAVVSDVDEAARNDIHDAVNYLSVLPIFVNPIFRSPVLEGLIDKYMDSPNVELPLQKIYDEKTPAEILELLKTGTTRFDKELESWLAEMGDEKLLEMYRQMFQKPDALPNVELIADTTLQGYQNANDFNLMLFVHLIARRFYKEAPEGLNMALGDHREYASLMIEQTGRALARFMDTRERAYQKKDLGIYYPSAVYASDNPSWNVITVNGDIYNDWLKDGGSPEILFGACITDRNRESKLLLEDRDRYTQAWGRQARIREAEVKNQEYSKTISALRRCISKQINQLSDDQVVTQDRGVFHERLQVELGHVGIGDLKEMYNVVRKLVCRTMFAHTDAETILARIDEVGKKYPGIDVREAALLAAIDVVTDWVAEQCTVTQAPRV